MSDTQGPWEQETPHARVAAGVAAAREILSGVVGSHISRSANDLRRAVEKLADAVEVLNDRVDHESDPKVF